MFGLLELTKVYEPYHPDKAMHGQSVSLDVHSQKGKKSKNISIQHKSFNLSMGSRIGIMWYFA